MLQQRTATFSDFFASGRVTESILPELPWSWLNAIQRSGPASVFILMTTDTTPFGKGLNGATVIVTTQALCRLMGTQKDDSSFLSMIETKIVTDLVPGPFFVAQRAVARK